MSSIAYTSPMTTQDCPNALEVTLYLEDPSRGVPRARLSLCLEDPLKEVLGQYKGYPLNNVLG